MINVSRKWAAGYLSENPETQIQVAGRGAGVSIAALIDGDNQIANAPRKMKSDEWELAGNNTGKTAIEFVVDEEGKTVTWKQLDNSVPGCAADETVRASRQISRGTYVYFRVAILDKKRNYKQGSTLQIAGTATQHRPRQTIPTAHFRIPLSLEFNLPAIKNFSARCRC